MTLLNKYFKEKATVGLLWYELDHTNVLDKRLEWMKYQYYIVISEGLGMSCTDSLITLVKKNNIN